MLTTVVVYQHISKAGSNEEEQKMTTIVEGGRYAVVGITMVLFFLNSS
jgi:hypothetical protein